MFKNKLVTTVIISSLVSAIIGGILAVILYKILRPQTTTQIQKETVIIPPSDYFSEAIKKIEPSVAAIQSFSGGQLVRSGSGIVLTQDGLIATTNSVAPADASVFQVFNGGKIYKAKVVFRDYEKNIAIISVPEADFQVAKFKSGLPNLGGQLLIFSKQVSFSKENPFVEEAMVSRVNEENGTFLISAAYDHQLFGSALADGEGTVLGMVDFRNQKPVVIFSKLIEETLGAYLARPKN